MGGNQRVVFRLLGVGLLSTAAVVACVGDSSTPTDGGVDADLTGTAGHACYKNNTCNPGLTCISQVCVDLGGDAGDAAMDVAVGDAGCEGSTCGLGTSTNPALSCKALLAALPATPSGNYSISPTGILADEFTTYCDMTTEGGGWTQVTASVSDAFVHLLLGASGRQMVKCWDTSANYIESPSFAISDGGGPDGSIDWTWNAGHFVLVPGTWRVTGSDQSCGANPDFSMITCGWWGVGCDNGPGPNNKLIPGVVGYPPDCGGPPYGGTAAAFNTCTTLPDGAPADTLSLSFSIFVRAD